MIRTFKLLACAFFLLFGQSAIAQVAQWTLSEASGRVIVRDAGGEHAARRGSLVVPGATLSTGPGSRAVVVRGKDFVTVAANSRIRIPTADQNSGGFDVVQEWGNAVFQIEKKKNPHFGVRTPYLAAVVKGTTFSITVTHEGASLQVLEGAVETSTGDGGARELIRPGIVASVSAADQFRLTVRGTDTRTIDSPARGAAPAAGSAPAASTAPASETQQPEPQPQPEPKTSETAPPSTAAMPTSPSAAEQVDRSADMLAAQTISEMITAQPTDLGKATGGLIGGTNMVQVASAQVAALTRVDSNHNGPAGNGPGNPGPGSAPGSSGANGPGSNGGPGNGNGGPGSNVGPGNGNGNAGPGSDGGPGNGSGNAGPGSNGGPGNGNGNAGPGSNGGPGNGNGNAGPGSDGGPGNGNGNAGPGSDGGPGNGNGNASPGSNGGPGNGSGPGTDGGPGNSNGPGSNGQGNGNAGPGTDGGPGNAGPGTNGGPGNGGPGSNGGPGNSNPRPVVDGDVGPGNGVPGNRNTGPGNGKG
jgi:hypothetical protein